MRDFPDESGQESSQSILELLGLFGFEQLELLGEFCDPLCVRSGHEFLSY